MTACRTAFARLPAAWLVKYDTVIGTIGKTHGVSSDSAPTVIASQRNDQMEPCRCTGDVWPAQIDEADAVPRSKQAPQRRQAAAAAWARRPPARPSAPTGPVADSPRRRLGRPDGRATGAPATSIATSIGTVFGGRQSWSLHVWKYASMRTVSCRRRVGGRLHAAATNVALPVVELGVDAEALIEGGVRRRAPQSHPPARTAGRPARVMRVAIGRRRLRDRVEVPPLGNLRRHLDLERSARPHAGRLRRAGPLDRVGLSCGVRCDRPKQGGNQRGQQR